MMTKNTQLIIGSFLAGLCMMACTDYEGSKAEEMEMSNITLNHATGTISGCALQGGITDVVDCYLTLTAFDGTSTTVKVDEAGVSSDVFQSTAQSGLFSTKLSLRINDRFAALQSAGKVPTSYDYTFKPGKLTGMLYVQKATGADSTYTFTCANAERSGTLVGDSINGEPGPVTEANLKAWMKTIYNSGVRASFYYLINEKGWPVCYARNDDVPEYDFE